MQIKCIISTVGARVALTSSQIRPDTANAGTQCGTSVGSVARCHGKVGVVHVVPIVVLVWVIAVRVRVIFPCVAVETVATGLGARRIRSLNRGRVYCQARQTQAQNYFAKHFSIFVFILSFPKYYFFFLFEIVMLEFPPNEMPFYN